MSRSNYDKPFYVDVGTSIVAIRCASNHDVLVRHDHIWHPHTLNLANEVCDRMNKEVEIDKFLNKEAETDKPLRNCDVGSVEEQVERLFSGIDNKEDKIGLKFVRSIVDEVLTWSQKPYKKEEAK